MSAIGELNLRLTLLRPVFADDGSGGALISYEVAGHAWGAVRTRSMSERLVADHLDGVASHSIRLRYREDAVGGWRLSAGTRSFRVLAANDPDGRRRWLDVIAQEEGR